jgi:hypothetical protein
MSPSEAEELWTENARLTRENLALRKAVEILMQKQFDDCFNYICQSQSECQQFGCAVQNKIKEIKNNDNETF